MNEIQELQTWLEGILGEPVDWEINPETVEMLKRIRDSNIQKEQHSQLILSELEQSRAEYVGETRRLENILKELGVHDRFLTGPSQAYAQMLTDCCSTLAEDGLGSGLEAAAANLLLNQAEGVPDLALARTQLNEVKADTLKLYGQLDRLGEAVKMAEKGKKEDSITCVNRTKKLDFMLGKEKNYRANLEKDEASLFKVTGGDTTSFKHANVVKIEAELRAVEGEIEEAQRQLTSYLNLPPSVDLARVEVTKAENELQKLTAQVNFNLSSLHL